MQSLAQRAENLYFYSDGRIFKKTKSMKLPVLTVTIARAFHQDMPIDEQMNLSETARYYNHCFDLKGLHQVYNQHNDLIAHTSQFYKYPVLRLDQIMPGGNEYFGDATHFSEIGTDYVAQLLAKKVASLKIIPIKPDIHEKGARK